MLDKTPLAPRALAPLPPTAATLLRCERTDGRAVLTIIASDVVVSRTAHVLAETLGFEPNLALLMQRTGSRILAQLGIAIDVWASGTSHRSATISAAHMALGPLTIACLAPLALPGDLDEADAPSQFGMAAFALFGSLASSLIARQEPDLFERVAELARYRAVPINDAYSQVAGESIHTAAARLASGWALPRELTLALAGPEGGNLSPGERSFVAALGHATAAARAAAVSVEPWPYATINESIEDFAFAQALTMRARRIAAKLGESLNPSRQAA